MKKGIFISFEGPDGSGKTTVSKQVYQMLLDQGYDCIYTREPGGSAIAEKIRDLILDPKNTEMDAKTEALLYAASRRQHLVEKVIPALDAKKIVICDRFIDSSLAYQGIARGLGFDSVKEINEFAIGDYYPDKTIYLDLDEAIGLQRIKKNRAFLDRLDQESIDFHHLVSEGYRYVLSRYQERMIKIDASQEVEKVIEDAYKKVIEIING